MTDNEAKQFAEQLYAKLEADTPEGIIGGLAHLVLMRSQFQSPDLYRAIMRTVVTALFAKVTRGT